MRSIKYLVSRKKSDILIITFLIKHPNEYTDRKDYIEIDCLCILKGFKDLHPYPSDNDMFRLSPY